MAIRRKIRRMNADNDTSNVMISTSYRAALHWDALQHFSSDTPNLRRAAFAMAVVPGNGFFGEPQRPKCHTGPLAGRDFLWLRPRSRLI
jgi:hypothetical protein